MVRVQNPGGAPVIVSVSVHRARHLFGLWPAGRQYRAALSVRPLRVKRRPRPPGGTLLGAVSGGSASYWEVPVRDAGPRPVLKVRLDQTGLRSRLFVWRMDWPDAARDNGGSRPGAPVVLDPDAAPTSLLPPEAVVVPHSVAAWGRRLHIFITFGTISLRFVHLVAFAACLTG